MNLRNAAKLCIWALIGLTIFSQESPVSVARAQEQDNVPKASPEMQHLQRLYLGTWDFTETYGKTSFSPNGGSDVGVYTSEPGPGGNSILNRFHSKGSVGEFEGMLVMTWDPKDKAYKSYVFGNASPGCVTQTGQFEGEDLVFRSEFATEGMKLKMRNVTRLAEAGKIVSEQFIGTEGAAEKLLVRVEAKKRQ